MCRLWRRAERCAGDDGIKYCGGRNVSHFFPAVRGVNKPAAFWDWFIPVITCVFLRCIVKSAGTLSHFLFFLSERRKPSEVPGSTRWSEDMYISYTRFQGLSGRMDQPMGKTGTAPNLSGSLKFQSCQFIYPDTQGSISQIYLPTCSREITSNQKKARILNG